MSTRFMLTRDISGGAWDFDSIPFALDSFAGLLVTSVAQSVRVPLNSAYWEMRIATTPGIEVWANSLGTAAIPAGAIASSASQLIANGIMKRYVKAGQVISFITDNADGARISIQFLAAQNYTN